MQTAPFPTARALTLPIAILIAAAAALLAAAMVPAAPPAEAAGPGLGPPAPQGAYVVTTTQPFGAGSLGQAIEDANWNSGPDTITFAPQVSGTIVLTDALPVIGGTLTIAGPGAGVLAISGANAYRVFEIDLIGVVTITGLTVRDGYANPWPYFGGGIKNLGTLTLAGDIITGNVASSYGGGIYSVGRLAVEDTSVVSNTGLSAGGIDCDRGTMSLERATISHNSGNWAGGVHATVCTYTMTNVTISGNYAIDDGRAGAIEHSSSTGVINHGTIVTNSARTVSRSGIHFATGNLAIGHSIVAQNAGGGNFSGENVASLGYNLTDSGAGTPLTAPTDITGTNPLIGVRQDNGGATRTYALLRGSPAIDPGPGPAAPSTDQRGQPRDSAPDIGAYEVTPALCWSRLTQEPEYRTATSRAIQLGVDAAGPGAVLEAGGYCGGVSARAGMTQTLQISKTLTVRGGYLTTPRPVARWPFFEMSGTVAHSYDDGLLGDHGFLFGPTWTAPGVPALPDNAGALSFDGIDDRVEVAKSDRLRLTSGVVAAWFSTAAGGEHQVILADERLNGSQVIWSYRLRVTPSGLLAFDFTTNNRAGGIIFERACSQWVADNQWHHAAAVRNDVNATVKLYLDGTQCGGDLYYTGAIDNSDNPMWIGLSPYAGGRYPFEGLIDDVRVYSAILSPAQVAALADGRAPEASGWGSADTDTHPTVLDALGRGTGVVVQGGAPVSVTLENLTVQGGRSAFAGGGIYSEAALTLAGIKLSGNAANFVGGGLCVAAGTADLRGVLISGNATPEIPLFSAGAGIYSLGVLTVTNSTITANVGGQGGGITSQSSLVLRHSTVSGNRALAGGGIVIGAGTAEIADSTIVNNTGTSVTSTSGILQVAGSTVIRNSIVARNAVTNNVKIDGGTFTSQGYNLTDSFAGAPFTHTTDLAETDPLLAPFQWYGGGTPTYALLEGSQAEDAIPAGANGCGDAGDTDQRGYPRPGAAGGACDIGAYERQSACQARIDTGMTFDSGDAAAVQAAVDASPVDGTVKVAGYCAGANPHAGIWQIAYIGKSVDLHGGYSAGDWEAPNSWSHPTVLDALGMGRGLYVTGGSGVYVGAKDLTVQNGLSAGDGAGIHDNRAAMDVFRVTLRDNRASGGRGGGMFVREAQPAVRYSRILSNTAAGGGGGLAVGRGADVEVSVTEIDGNQASGTGGGIVVLDGAARVDQSAVTGNSAALGGGISASGVVYVTNSTISGNTATGAGGGGGALHVASGGVSLFYATVTRNVAAELPRSGIWVAGGEFIPQSSIVSGNGGANNMAVSGGSLVSRGYNLTNSGAGTPLTHTTDITGTEAGLGPLKNNSGSTRTHALFPDSRAIDAIPPGQSECGQTMLADQRGEARPVGLGCDIGAYEGGPYLGIYLPLVRR